jgi:ABC-type transporter Mla maintaining outer membrane lipid asymmetry permease subunit MlaE
MSPLRYCSTSIVTSVSMLRLDITLVAYWQRTTQILDLWDVGSGVLKSVVFGWAIALVACQRGLATRGGAAGACAPWAPIGDPTFRTNAATRSAAGPA